MTEQAQEAQFAIQRVYVKDLSFEAPDSPNTFQKEWKPEMSLDINTDTNKLENEVFEVTLTLTVTVKNEGKVAFLTEVKQAGIFTIQGAPEEQLQHLLGSFCPSILYPYAREVVTDVVTRGSFPQLVLAPVNFDALYAQQMEGKQAPVEEATH